VEWLKIKALSSSPSTGKKKVSEKIEKHFKAKNEALDYVLLLLFLAIPGLDLRATRLARQAIYCLNHSTSPQLFTGRVDPYVVRTCAT
jgi:hypothetical protein